MRTMTAIESKTCSGIYMTPVKGGRDLELRVYDTVLAYATAREFDEMMRRGQAVIEPELTWTHDSAMGGRSTSVGGGAKILRCSVVKADNVPHRFCPETCDSKDLLFYHSWNGWMSNNKTCDAADGAKILASVGDDHWKQYFHLVMMPPGSALKYRRDHQVNVPGKFLRSRATTETTNVPCGETRFNADGKTINF